jgi:hypothetical protein
MLTILVFEIKGKNAQKVKYINHNLSLLEGDSNGRRPRVWGHTLRENLGILPEKIFEI